MITFVSGEFSLPAGQTLIEMRLTVSAGGTVVHNFIPTLTGRQGTVVDAFAVSQDTVIYTDSRFTITMGRSDVAGDLSSRVAVSGYLIDCSVAPCN